MTAQMDCVCLYVCAEYNRSDNKDRSLTISVELPAFTGGGGLCLGGPLIGEKKKRRRDNAVLITASLRHQIFFCAEQREQLCS